MPPRIGIDSYSYHRLLGEIRPGEEAPWSSFRRGSLDAIEHALALGVDGVSLETCFLPSLDELDRGWLRDVARELEVVLAWGHRHGLEFGANPEALADLLAWLDCARAVGCSLVRCVAASPGFRGRAPVAEQIELTVEPLAIACARARELGLRLALENHGDLTAAELLELVERVGDDALGVCFDTANALRLGEDPAAAAALLAPRVRLVHLKDVEAMTPATDPVAGPCSVPFGDGAVPLGDVLARLERAGFAGLVCVEIGQLAGGMDELALIERSVAWLQDYESSNG
jgi:sugar phosphate isomerase/epimerase